MSRHEATAKPPILPILEHYGWDGQLSGYSQWKVTRCPFHYDRHASASVNLEDDIQAFTCHACSVKGDAYTLVMLLEGTDFAEAKRLIQEWTGYSNGSVSGRYERLRSYLPVRSRDRQRRNQALQAR